MAVRRASESAHSRPATRAAQWTMRPFSAPQLNPADASGWRRYWFDIIYRHDTPPSRNFDLLLVLAIIGSVIVVMIDSVQHLHLRWATALYALEWAFTILFSIE